MTTKQELKTVLKDMDDPELRAHLLTKARSNVPLTVEEVLELEGRTAKKERTALAGDRAKATTARKLADQERAALERERQAYIANTREVPDTPVLPLEEITQRLRDRHLAAVEKYGNSIDFTEVGRQVIADLEAQKRTVVLNLLGMDNSFGRWEVKDYKNTPIGNLMEEACGETLRMWVGQAVAEVLTEEKQGQIRTLLRSAVRKYIADQVSRSQGYELENRVKELLSDLSHSVLSEIRKEMNLPDRPKENKRW